MEKKITIIIAASVGVALTIGIVALLAIQLVQLQQQQQQFQTQLDEQHFQTQIAIDKALNPNTPLDNSSLHCELHV